MVSKVSHIIRNKQIPICMADSNGELLVKSNSPLYNITTKCGW